MGRINEDERYRALIVYDGITPRYRNLNLKKIRKLLVSRGFPHGNIQSLENNLSSNEVLDALDNLQSLDNRAMPAIFVCCHGIRRNDETYLEFSRGEISTSDFFKSLELIPGNKLIVPNCCHNGGIVDYLDNHDLTGEYVILGSCNAEETTSFHPSLFSDVQLVPSTLALEKIARKNPSARVNLATIDYSPDSILADIFGYVLDVLYFTKVIEDRIKIRSKRSSNSSYLF